MSEQHVETSSNGASAPAARADRNTFAHVAVKGSIASVQFTHDNTEVSVDVSKLSDETKALVLAQGVAHLLRMSYQNADTNDERVKSAQACAESLVSGKWKPGTRASAHGKHYDDLTVALAEHLKAKRPEMTPRKVDEEWLPGYLARKCPEKDKRGRMVGAKAARDGLAAHPEIAVILARFASERAKAAAHAARGKQPAPMFDE